MTKKYLMGVDVGTQSAKVIIIDLEGNIVCQGSQALRKMDIPAPQLAVHPDDDLWDALKIAFHQVMTRFNDEVKGNVEDILSMGICIIRCCRVLLKENGRLAYPVIDWMDKRLNTPYEHRAAYGDVRYVTTTSGYITHRLTNEFKDTCANYIGWWPMDNDTLDWSKDDELIKECNVPRQMLFDVVKPGEILGVLSDEAGKTIGLPKGIPVVATAHDKAVEALGAGSLAPGIGLISLGTYIGALVHGHKNMKEAKNFWAFQASVPGRYLYECMGVRRGMWTISWFCDQFGEGIIDEAKNLGMTIEELFNREAQKIPAGCEGLLTIHDWAPPVEAEYRKGVMFGFDGRHTRAHIYRSILEGIAFTVKNHMDKMNQELNTPIKHLIISGGGANSNVFMQIFADIFGVTTSRNQMKGSAAIGCVINAGMAVNAFDSYEKAVEKMVHKDDEFKPNFENTKFYKKLNEKVYAQVNPHFDPILKELSALVD
ncbi:MAG: sugar kinase [Desulfobacula sp.]|uniref:FGGY-family carbohydrate kinase n=1 Tax=Desulfobacula sp. TaxID=2593537 RepID=UPI001E0B1A44|nr:sugar kinase [Desulfobacula sp.]MBT3483714.1 sugar kinase [Desulfobacula sp.]MBT3803511.1 sugar kinase [Desulfobacula sp.]MBT4023306.1 sugar kinase [Desulfobacula sp.]MBT4197291.1 sugar kinase [Desulfobacula sp.]